MTYRPALLWYGLEFPEAFTMTDAGQLLTPKQAAEVTGLSTQTLANMRSTGRGPAYYKLSNFVRYDENDLIAWMRSRRYTSTSQEAAARPTRTQGAAFDTSKAITPEAIKKYLYDTSGRP